MNYVCERCREEVAVDASVCPHCEFDPGAELSSQAKWRWGVGALLCLTVVGGVIGIPLVISGFLRARKIDEARPGVEVADVAAA